MSTLNNIETINKVIEMCIAFKKDMIENGNELLQDQDEEKITIAITHAFYIIGYRNNGWINLLPYDGDYSLPSIPFKKD